MSLSLQQEVALPGAGRSAPRGKRYGRTLGAAPRDVLVLAAALLSAGCPGFGGGSAARSTPATPATAVRVTDVWTQETAAAPWSARYGHTSVVFNGNLWVIGGTSDDGDLNDLWSSPDGVNWTQERDTAPWSGREDHTSLVFNAKIWVIGGAASYEGHKNDVWSSPNGVDWTQETAAPLRQAQGRLWSARDRHTSLVFNGKIWVLGGYDGGARKNDVWSSPDGVNWTQETAAAPWSARDDHTSLVFNAKIWVIGGDTKDGFGGKVNDVWSSADGVKWTQETAGAPWIARDAHTSAVFYNRLWVLGGRDDDGADRNDVWCSPDGANWTEVTEAAPWRGRSEYTSVVFDDRLWVLGGAGDDGRLNDVWSFRAARAAPDAPRLNAPAADCWRVTLTWDAVPGLKAYHLAYGTAAGQTAATRTRRAGVTSPLTVNGLANGTTYYFTLTAVNSVGESRPSNEVSATPRAAGTASDAPTLAAAAAASDGQKTAAARWSARRDHAGVLFYSRLWVLGGRDYDGEELNDVWSSPDGAHWDQEIEAAPWGARFGHTGVVFNDKIWIIGGYGDDEYYNDVWSSPDGVNWTQETAAAPWSARHDHASVVFRDRLWILGGDDADGYRNDVWSSADGAHWTQETDAAPWGGSMAHASVVRRDRLWLLGGIGDSGSGNDVWSSPDGVNWTEEAAAPSAAGERWSGRLDHVAVFAADRLWVTGGWVGREVAADLWASADGANWTRETDAVPWGARHGHAAVATGATLWVLGGEGNGGCHNDVWAYRLPGAPPAPPVLDPPVVGDRRVTLTWSAVAGARRYHLYVGSTPGVTALNAVRIADVTSPYVHGGLSRDTTCFYRLTAENAAGESALSNEVSATPAAPRAGAWVQETPAEGWSEREGHTSVVFKGRLWVLGGDSGSSATNEVWSSPDGLNWTQATDTAAWSPRYGHASVVFRDRLWVLGGTNSWSPDNDATRVKSDVWSSPDGVNWTLATDAAPWGPRSGHTCVVFDDKLWLFGAENDTDGAGGVWCSSDGVNWTRTTEAAPWGERSSIVGVAFDHRLWVYGSWYDDQDKRHAGVWHSSDGVQWTRAANAVPWASRWGHAVAVFKGRLWALGGDERSDVWSSPDGVNWAQATSAAPWGERRGHTSVAFGSQLWVLGGDMRRGDPSNECWSSPDGVNWTRRSAAAPWSARAEHASAAFNGRLWVIGGWSQKDLWSSPDGVHWTAEQAGAWSACNNRTAAVFNGRLWVLGGAGTGKDGQADDTWSTPDGVNWMHAITPAPWAPRYDHTSAVSAGKLWVIGGVAAGDGGGFRRDVWSSNDGVNWTAETAAAPWRARGDHASAVFKDRLWVLGGDAGGGEYLSDIWSSPDGVNWTQETDAAPWGPRAGHTTTVFQERLWLLGGRAARGDEATRNDVWSSADGANWTREEDAPWRARWLHNAAVFRDRLWVLGGAHGYFGPVTNDVWSFR